MSVYVQEKLDGYLRLKDVLLLLSISESNFRRGQKTGKYPPGIRLGEKTVVYRRSTIAQLLDKIALHPHRNSKEDVQPESGTV